LHCSPFRRRYMPRPRIAPPGRRSSGKSYVETGRPASVRKAARATAGWMPSPPTRLKRAGYRMIRWRPVRSTPPRSRLVRLDRHPVRERATPGPATLEPPIKGRAAQGLATQALVALVPAAQAQAPASTRTTADRIRGVNPGRRPGLATQAELQAIVSGKAAQRSHQSGSPTARPDAP
jgi:hypothetical protein